MNRKITTILISFLLLLISVILLIAFLIIPSNLSNAVKPLSISSQDYNLTIGERVEKFYQVSKVDSIVSFEIEDENIVKIDGEDLVAQQAGYTSITIKAEYENEKTQMTIAINVYMPNYSLNIKPVNNCSFIDNNLYYLEEPCQFQIEIIDKNNSVLTNTNIQIMCDDDVEIYQEFLNWTLITKRSCKLIIKEENINCQFTLNVIV